MNPPYMTWLDVMSSVVVRRAPQIYIYGVGAIHKEEREIYSVIGTTRGRRRGGQGLVIACLVNFSVPTLP